MNAIKRIFLSVCAVLAAGSAVIAQGAKEKSNVLFIFADDMSFETIGAYGLLDIDTPNLNRLVTRGATFTHAYNMGAWNGAVCQASRTMLNTGRFVWNAQRTNLHEYSKQNHMWSQRMKKAGYETYMSGKWHVSTEVEPLFDEVKHVRPGMPEQTPAGYDRPKSPKDYEKGWKPWDKQQGGFWEGGTHWSEVLRDDAIEFIGRASKTNDPFFMYLAFNAPHDPRQSPREYIDRYPLDRIKLPEDFRTEYPDGEAIFGKNLRDERLLPYPRTEYAVKVNRQEYFALITHLDDQIGLILEALEKSGKGSNTYIIFTADNGLSIGHHGLEGKQNMYDPAVRVPFIIAGPGIEPGLKIDTPIYLQDAMATALELAGDSGTDGVDFKSLLPLLRGETKEHYGEIYGSYIGTQRMVTKDGWKLIAYPTLKKRKLFNLAKDPAEMNDLASNPEHAAQLEQLTALLETTMDSMDDPMTSLEAADYLDVGKDKGGH